MLLGYSLGSELSLPSVCCMYWMYICKQQHSQYWQLHSCWAEQYEYNSSSLYILKWSSYTNPFQRVICHITLTQVSGSKHCEVHHTPAKLLPLRWMLWWALSNCFAGQQKAILVSNTHFSQSKQIPNKKKTTFLPFFYIFIFLFLSFPCWLVFIWTMPKTWFKGHFLCLFTSSRWIT